MLSIQAEMETLFGFSVSWLYAFEDNSKIKSRLISVVGKNRLEIESRYPSIDITNDEMMENIFSSDSPIYVEDARVDHRTDKQIVNALDYRSVINCQLFLHGKSLGLIGGATFESEGIRTMSPDEIAYFSALTNIVSMSLDRISYREKSLLDPLTSLYNKRGLALSAETLFALARRNSQKLSIIFIDLDDFKPINDRYGHDWGDQALITFSNCLKKLSRCSDIVARVGGDEFVLILMNFNDEDDIHKLLGQMNDEYTLLTPLKNTVKMSFSAGRSVFPDDGTNLDNLVNLADKRMYQVKSISKRFAPSM